MNAILFMNTAWTAKGAGKPLAKGQSFDASAAGTAAGAFAALFQQAVTAQTQPPAATTGEPATTGNAQAVPASADGAPPAALSAGAAVAVAQPQGPVQSVLPEDQQGQAGGLHGSPKGEAAPAHGAATGVTTAAIPNDASLTVAVAAGQADHSGGQAPQPVTGAAGTGAAAGKAARTQQAAEASPAARPAAGSQDVAPQGTALSPGGAGAETSGTNRKDAEPSADRAPEGAANAKAPAGQAPEGAANAKAPAGQAPEGAANAKAPAGQAPEGAANAKAPAGQSMADPAHAASAREGGTVVSPAASHPDQGTAAARTAGPQPAAPARESGHTRLEERGRALDSQGAGTRPGANAAPGHTPAPAPVLFQRPEAAKAESPAATAVAVEPRDIVGQVIGRMKVSISGDRTEARIHLIPEQLGPVDLKVSLEGGQLTARFHVATRQVQEILEQHLPELRQALHDQSIRVEQFTVSLGSGTTARNSGEEHQTAAWRSQTGRHVGYGRHQEDPAAPVSAPAMRLTGVSAARLDLIA